ncbi:FecR family protein [Sphingobacterium hotanense]|uniref:FecR family protein n=1 Tax=Sphingobacterium TaxID=28453 RepID=UPI0021A6A3B0|nr:FecR domain-containing protein [Sphingobacterium hotanense]MCT1525074.1 DUF4974 domain-containing protein [Sphingobacterium hotanense]
MAKENIKDILQKAGKETLNKEEKSKVKRWLFQLHQNEPSGLSEEQVLEAKKEIWARFEPTDKRKPVRRLWYTWAAAVTVVFFVLGGLYYFQQEVSAPKSVYGGDVAPGKNGATLTLADGAQIRIDEALTGNIAEQSGVMITKDADGQIIYEIVSNETNVAGYNTLATTRGEQTKIRLPDGTLVYLNASSSLRYPTSFVHSKERTVHLSGEGYFQVAKAYIALTGMATKQSQPFIVETVQQKVEVLGTKFNINAYTPNSVLTTLEEGAVVVSSEVTSQQLKPGEQVLNDGRKLILEQADLDQVLGWKDGNFVFMGADIRTVMEQLSLWYDVDVVYEGKEIEGVFYANISRQKNISEILKVLEKTNGVRFKIQGRRVTVMK